MVTFSFHLANSSELNENPQGIIGNGRAAGSPVYLARGDSSGIQQSGT